MKLIVVCKMRNFFKLKHENKLLSWIFKDSIYNEKFKVLQKKTYNNKF